MMLLVSIKLVTEGVEKAIPWTKALARVTASLDVASVHYSPSPTMGEA